MLAGSFRSPCWKARGGCRVRKSCFYWVCKSQLVSHQSSPRSENIWFPCCCVANLSSFQLLFEPNKRGVCCFSHMRLHIHPVRLESAKQTKTNFRSCFVFGWSSGYRSSWTLLMCVYVFVTRESCMSAAPAVLPDSVKYCMRTGSLNNKSPKPIPISFNVLCAACVSLCCCLLNFTP